jgi:hypothetical protein
MGSIYLGEPCVDSYHLIFLSTYYTMKIHTQSFPTFCGTCSFRDFVDPHNCVEPHGGVVSHLPTFLYLSSWNHTLAQIPFGCHEWCGGMLMVGSLPSISVVSPQQPASGASVGSPNAHLQVLIRLCSTTICVQTDRMYIRRDT